jgi:succinoglycan biosynthesis transport protein ExoP
VTPHDASLPEPTSQRPRTRRDDVAVAGRIEPAAPPAPPESNLPPGLSSGPDAWAILRALRRRWVAAVCLGGTLAALAAVGAWFLLSPKYTAFARIRVAYRNPIMFEKAGSDSAADFRTYIKTQAQRIVSRPVIWSTLKRDDVKRLGLESLVPDPAAYIEEEIKVEHLDESEIMTVLLTSFDPVVATTVLKGIVASYMDDVVYAEDKEKRKRVTELERTRDDAAEGLKKKKDLLKKLAKDLGTNDPAVLMQWLLELNTVLHDVQQQRNQITGEIVRIKADLDSLDAQLQANKEEKGPGAPLAPPVRAAVRADATLKELQTRMMKVESVVEKFRDRGQMDRPAAFEAAKMLAQLQGQVARRIKEIEEEVLSQPIPAGPGGLGQGREPLLPSRTQMVNRLRALEKLHADLKAEADDLIAQKAKLGQTNSEYESTRNQILSEETVLNELNVQLAKEQFELRAAQRINVIQEAELQRKDMKKQVIATVVAPVGVLFLVCMGLAWTEHRQRRVLTAGEVARGLGIRIVGAVPDMPDLERRLVSPEGEVELEGHPVMESIDAIRTLLLRDGEAARAVLVTSATSGEGKTTLAAHLAGSLARAGRKTLLIDGDLRNPSAHQLFELPVQPGFSEVLLGEVEMADAVKATPLEGLWFLAAGQWDREVMQALARGDLEAVFDKLREEFDFLIVDSHPVLAATDALLLGQQTDAVILSVLREVSQMPRVWTAVQRLEGLGIRVLGAVVNGADPEEALPSSKTSRHAAA